jgi:hypothetical protein
MAAQFSRLAARAVASSDAKSVCPNLSSRRCPPLNHAEAGELRKKSPVGRVRCHVFDPIDPPPDSFLRSNAALALTAQGKIRLLNGGKRHCPSVRPSEFLAKSGLPRLSQTQMPDGCAPPPCALAVEVSSLPRPIRSRDNSATVIVRGGGGIALDEACSRQGLPRPGRTEASPLRSALQVLPLALEIIWDPLAPERLLEFLSLPQSPLPRSVARRFVRALVEQAKSTSGWSRARFPGGVNVKEEGDHEFAPTTLSVNSGRPPRKDAQCLLQINCNFRNNDSTDARLSVCDGNRVSFGVGSQR